MFCLASLLFFRVGYNIVPDFAYILTITAGIMLGAAAGVFFVYIVICLCASWVQSHKDASVRYTTV
jgi:hypothetical protein